MADQSTRYSVLVVDDDAALLETTVANIEDHHTTMSTGRPSEAIQLLHQHKFDVLIVDWMMPLMNGMDLIKIALKAHPSLACIVMTGQPETFVVDVPVEQRKRLGFIKKPFTAELMLERIRQVGRLGSMRNSVAKMKAGE